MNIFHIYLHILFQLDMVYQRAQELWRFLLLHMEPEKLLDIGESWNLFYDLNCAILTYVFVNGIRFGNFDMDWYVNFLDMGHMDCFILWIRYRNFLYDRQGLFFFDWMMGNGMVPISSFVNSSFFVILLSIFWSSSFVRFLFCRFNILIVGCFLFFSVA